MRRAARLSQELLAHLAGCSVSMVKLLENGYRPESSAVLGRIAAILAQTDDRAPGDGARVDTTLPVGVGDERGQS